MEVFWGHLLTFWLSGLTAVNPAVELCFRLKETCVPILVQVCGATDVSSLCDLHQRSYSVILQRSLYAGDEHCFVPSVEWEDIRWLALVWSRHWHILFPPARLYLGADALLEASKWLVSSPVEVAPSCVKAQSMPEKPPCSLLLQGKADFRGGCCYMCRQVLPFWVMLALRARFVLLPFIGMNREYIISEKEDFKQK